MTASGGGPVPAGHGIRGGGAGRLAGLPRATGLAVAETALRHRVDGDHGCATGCRPEPAAAARAASAAAALPSRCAAGGPSHRPGGRATPVLPLQLTCVAADRSRGETVEQHVAQRRRARGARDRLDGGQQPGDDGAEEHGQHQPADRPERRLRVVGQPSGRQQGRRAGHDPAKQARRLRGEPWARHHQADQDDDQAGERRLADGLRCSSAPSRKGTGRCPASSGTIRPRRRRPGLHPAADAERRDPHPLERYQPGDEADAAGTPIRTTTVARQRRRDLVREVPLRW